MQGSCVTFPCGLGCLFILSLVLSEKVILSPRCLLLSKPKKISLITCIADLILVKCMSNANTVMVSRTFYTQSWFTTMPWLIII